MFLRSFTNPFQVKLGDLLTFGRDVEHGLGVVMSSPCCTRIFVQGTQPFDNRISFRSL